LNKFTVAQKVKQIGAVGIMIICDVMRGSTTTAYLCELSEGIKLLFSEDQIEEIIHD